MLVDELIGMGERISSRTLLQHRDISINYFPNLVAVSSGNSTVLLTYNKSIGKPYKDKPADGIFNINLLGKKNDSLINFIYNSYKRSKCIVLDIIKYNQVVEILTINIRVIESDGDLYRLCLAGINGIIKQLGIKHTFIPIYYRYASIGEHIIADPEYKELAIADWTIHIAMKSTREILVMEKTGKQAKIEEIMSVVDEAFKNRAKLKRDQI